jgi:hypothetical protein
MEQVAGLPCQLRRSKLDPSKVTEAQVIIVFVMRTHWKGGEIATSVHRLPVSP